MIQELGQCEDFVVIITQNRVFLTKNGTSYRLRVKAYQEYPPPKNWNLLWRTYASWRFK